jgi:hypothetical protein
MADAKTDYLEDALLNHVLRNTAYSSPATVYVALYTVAPTDTGGGTEVSGFGYARQAVTFGAPVSGTVSNTGAVTFPAASGGAWGTIVAMGIFDASTSGNLLYYGNLTTPKVVGDGDQISFPNGALTVSET